MENKKISIAEWVRLSESGIKFSAEIPLNGNSMLPFIRNKKDTVVISPVAENIKTGDIVLADICGTFVVHRVAKINGNMFTTLGDNCLNYDTPVERKNILGIVTEIKRNGKTVSADGLMVSLYGKGVKIFLPVRRLVHRVISLFVNLKNKL